MKNLLSLATMVVAIGLSSLTSFAQTNLVNNASFEDPLGFDFADTSNWNGFFGGPEGTVLTAFNDTGATPRTGSAALELGLDGVDGTTNGTNAFVGHAQLVSGVDAGRDFFYRIFARNNASALTGNVEFRVEFRDIAGAEISREQILLEDSLTDTFQQFEISGITPDGTTSANIVVAIASFNQDVLHDNSVVFDDASFSVSAIPEPSSLALLRLGIAGIAGFRRRR
jgi:hypothetical protein